MCHRPIHVLHVVPGLEPGGMEMAMARVIRALDRRGMRHSVVCLKGPAVIRDQIPDSVDIHCLHTVPNDPLLPWRLWRLILLLRPTVIHARNWGAWPDVAVARLGMLPAVPLIFSFHGFARADSMPLRRRLAFRALSRITSSLFTVSEPTRRMLIKDLGWPAGRVRVIPNGVDTDRFTPSVPESHAPKTVVIGTVGSLTPVKNQALLIRACAQLAGSGIKCELRLAGEGQERQRLLDLARTLDVSDRVHLLGHVDDVPQFLRQLDIFALPSRSEAHPNALLEAMACGLPCVATRVGGVADVLDSGRVGRIVDPADEAGLISALAELADDPGLRRSLGQEARQWAKRQYGLESMIEAYGRLYRRTSRNRLGRADADNPAGLPRRPRVLMLGPLPPPAGGMATVVSNLSKSLLTRTCRLTVLDNGKATPEGRSLRRGISAQLRLLGRISATAIRTQTQIVHVHTCAMFSFWRDTVHVLAFRLLGRKVVWHIHDGSFRPFMSGPRPFFNSIIRRALAMGARVIVLSRLSLDDLRPLAPEVRWRVVSNGTPMPVGPDGPDDGPARLLFLGNLTRRKGAFDLVDAITAAGRDGFHGVARLAGGEVLPGQKEELLRHIEQSGCGQSIDLLGLIAGVEKEQALAESDCLVLPSYVEGLPMAVLEGMAYGLPVIATSVGAIPEAISDGREGFIIAPGDVSTLADRIGRLGADAELRRRMGRAGRARAAAEYSLDVMADRILEIYRDILGPRQRPADGTRDKKAGRARGEADATTVTGSSG